MEIDKKIEQYNRLVDKWKEKGYTQQQINDLLARGLNLLKMDEKTFKLAKEIFYDNKEIRFANLPLITSELFPYIINVRFLTKMNISQLKYLMSLINEELNKRED